MNEHTERTHCCECGIKLNPFDDIIIGGKHYCYDCVKRLFSEKDYTVSHYLRCTQAVGQVAMTPEMMDYIIEKLGNDLDPYGPDGSNPLAEAIYNNMDKARYLLGHADDHIAVTTVYVTSYQVFQMYGGDEEGGWWYWDYSPMEMHACIEYDEVIEWIKAYLSELARETIDAEDVHVPTIQDIEDIFCKPTRECYPGSSTERAWICNLHTSDPGCRYVIAAEVQPGSLSTTHRPIYE